MKLISKSEIDTRRIAAKIAHSLKGGEILALYGDLGAGKTTFVKGLAAALGVKETITSPTFVLMNVFECEKKGERRNEKGITTLVHIDAYRLKDSSELTDIGALDYLGRNDFITVIEWSERLRKLIKKFKKVITISFAHSKEPNQRVIVKR